MVARAASRALVVGDLPFLSYQVSVEEALRNAGRLMKEGGAEAVKLEGGIPMADTIRALTAVDIPVMGHVGLTPQSVHRMGGHKVQGKKHGHAAGGRERLIADALAVEEAGAFAVVLEGIPLDLAAEITGRLTIPTIGIGAGVHCDGQVLVLHDLLGLFDRFAPKFSKRYVNLREIVAGAVAEYVAEVESGAFPTDAHSFHSPKVVAREPIPPLPVGERPARSAG
jgi:3-methyl-2-oxobutanoate hydroxymethyltransferase